MKRFAVVGHPLGHSLSPALFAAAFKASGLDCEYGKEDVGLSELGLLIEKVRSGSYSGLSITVPYKEAVLPFLDGISSEAKSIGAVNTVYVLNGKVMGENTDWLGFRKALSAHVSLEGKTMLIYGAGGVARACLHALKDHKGRVFLTNRTEAKGRILAAEFGVMFAPAHDLPTIDIFVNATSASLDHEAGLLVPIEWLKKSSAVFDLVYGMTPLTETAKKLGILTIDAKEMLLYQAIRQFEIFTGKAAPAEAMASAIGL